MSISFPEGFYRIYSATFRIVLFCIVQNYLRYKTLCMSMPTFIFDTMLNSQREIRRCLKGEDAAGGCFEVRSGQAGNSHFISFQELMPGEPQTHICFLTEKQNSCSKVADSTSDEHYQKQLGRLQPSTKGSESSPIQVEKGRTCLMINSENKGLSTEAEGSF